METLIGAIALLLAGIGATVATLRHRKRSRAERAARNYRETTRRLRSSAFHRWIAPSADKAVERLRGTPQPR